jgi:hypothetical protein
MDRIQQLDEDLLARPFRLVSLLQMLDKYGFAFYKIGQTFEGLWAAALMSQRYDDPPSVPGLKGLDERDKERAVQVRALLKQKLSEQAPSLRSWFKSVGLNLSLKSLERFEDALERDLTFEEVRHLLDDLQKRIEDELDSVWFFHVSAENLPLYNNPKPFGDLVTDNFADAIYDIEEAGKCLALDRGTACVMHLMRVIELAVDALALGVGVHIGAVQAATSWEYLLKDINTKIQEANKTQIPTWLTSKSFFENSYTYVLAVKNAWRNPSMHLEKKYTIEEAARIYNAVKDLMEHLATHLNQAGVYRT